MNLESLYIALGFKLEGVNNLRQFERGLKSAQDRMAAFAAAAARYGAIAAAAVSVGTAALAKSVIDAGSEMEQFGIRLEAMEGSAEAAKKALDFAKDFSRQSHLGIREATDAYVRLKAYGLDPTTGALQVAADTAALAGGETETLNGIILAMGQIWGKQSLQAEEANQLIERGVPVWTLLSEAMGKSVAEVRKLGEDGKLGAEQVQLLFDAMGERASGASARFIDTWDGALVKLYDMWFEFRTMIADAGFFEWIKSEVDAIRDTFDQFRKDGTLQKVAEGISQAMKRAGEAIGDMFKNVTADDIVNAVNKLVDAGKGLLDFAIAVKNTIQSMGDFINEALGMEGSLAGLAIMFGAVAFALNPWIAAFGLLVLVLDDVMSYLNGGNSVIGKALVGLQKIFDDFGIDADFSPEAIKKTLDTIGQAFKDMNVAIGIGAAATAVVIAKVVRGLGNLTGLPVFRILMIAAAVTTLFNAFKDVGSIQDFVDALKGLDAVQWGAIGLGIFAMIKPIRAAVNAIRSLIQGVNKLRGLPLPEAPGGDTSKRPKPSSPNGGWLMNLFRGALPVSAFTAALFANSDLNRGEDDYVTANLGPGGTSPELAEAERKAHLQAAIDGLFERAKAGMESILTPIQNVMQAVPSMDATISQSHFQANGTRDLNLLASMGPAIESFTAKTASFTNGPAAAAESGTLQQITNDNSVVNQTVNATANVTVNQTNASVPAITAGVRNGVTQAGLDATRRMGVVGNSGGAAP